MLFYAESSEAEVTSNGSTNLAATLFTDDIQKHVDNKNLVGCVVVVVVVVYFILSRLLYLAFSANLGLLCMPHPGMGPLV